MAQLLPEASLVLPVYNEGRRLSETLAALRDSTDVPYEAIVMNDASTDACCNFLRADPPPFPNVVLIDLAKRHGVAPARNLGADRAKAPVLVFMDGHCNGYNPFGIRKSSEWRSDELQALRNIRYSISTRADGRYTRYNRSRKETPCAIAALLLRRFTATISQPMNGSSSGHWVLRGALEAMAAGHSGATNVRRL